MCFLLLTAVSNNMTGTHLFKAMRYSGMNNESWDGRIALLVNEVINCKEIKSDSMKQTEIYFDKSYFGER